MAKRRKTKRARVTKRRSSKMNGLNGIDFTNILGVVAGAVGAKFVKKYIPETLDTKIVAGGTVALGVALPMFVKGGNMKNIVSGIGSGMVAAGAIDLLSSLGVLQGLGLVEENGERFEFVNSLGLNVLGQNTNVLGGMND